MAGIRMHIAGMANVQARLDQLSRRLRGQALRKIVRAGGAPILRAVRRDTPTRTGAMKAAMAQKPIVYKNGRAITVIGPARTKVKKKGETVQTATGRRLAKKGLGDVDPANIAHLVEAGHKIVKGGRLGRANRKGKAIGSTGGRVVGQVAGKHFFEPNVKANDKAALRAMAEKAEEELIRRGH